MAVNDLKERFLHQYNEKTQYYMRYIIYADVLKIIEDKKNKDLYQFSRDELLQLIGELNPSSLQAAITQLSVIRKYISFAMANGYLTTGINFANLITQEDLSGFINNRAIELKHLTKEEITGIANTLNNSVDSAFIMLLFEGIKGESLNEIINLKREDVDFNNCILKLTDNGNIRYRKVSEETINILQEASEQKDYLVIVDTSKRSLEFTKRLQDTDYIIRSTGVKGIDPVKYRTLLAKLRTIKSEIGNPYLTVTSIWESGMINYAKELMGDKGITELNTEHYKEISKWAGRSEDLWFNTKRTILQAI